MAKVSNWMDKYLVKKETHPSSSSETEEGSDDDESNSDTGVESEGEDSSVVDSEDEEGDKMPELEVEPKMNQKEFKLQVLNDPLWKELRDETQDKKLLAHAVVFNMLQKVLCIIRLFISLTVTKVFLRNSRCKNSSFL